MIARAGSSPFLRTLLPVLTTPCLRVEKAPNLSSCPPSGPSLSACAEERCSQAPAPWQGCSLGALQGCSPSPDLLEGGGRDFARGLTAQAGFPRAHWLSGRLVPPSQPSGLSWPCCSATGLCLLPGCCLLFLSRRAGAGVREGQAVLLHLSASKLPASFSNISSEND